MLVALFGVAIHAQTLAFSFDDGLDPRTQPQAAAWNRAMLDALAKANVKAILFPAGRVVDSADGMALVTAWGDAGHAIGNHSYAHGNFGSPRVSLATFIADVQRADALYKALPGWTPLVRFPYLKEGETAEKRDGFRAWMKANGYRGAPVSIETSDWYYSSRFVAWREKNPDAEVKPYREAYLAHLWDRAQHYDAEARALVGRSPKHMLLLHTNAINAAFIGDVIAMFRSKGWRIVAPAEAFADPLYASTPDTLPAGESIVWALAKQRGASGLRYPAEDGVYEKPLLDKLGL